MHNEPLIRLLLFVENMRLYQKQEPIVKTWKVTTGNFEFQLTPVVETLALVMHPPFPTTKHPSFGICSKPLMVQSHSAVTHYCKSRFSEMRKGFKYTD